jgi:hypothetical protein
MPNFRWSEQRFPRSTAASDYFGNRAVCSALRAGIRAFGFRSVAGKRILGRPANSLIGLDEVFDAAESTLRKVDELSDAFVVYDKINAEIIAHLPIMERLQAKLILKALFLLSFEGTGTTAEEISAAALVFDERDNAHARRVIEELLEKFASVFSNDIQRSEQTAGKHVTASREKTRKV